MASRYFLSKGYNIIMPNYTGSTGFGQKFLDGLAGKIGEIDIEEVIAHVN